MKSEKWPQFRQGGMKEARTAKAALDVCRLVGMLLASYCSWSTTVRPSYSRTTELRTAIRSSHRAHDASQQLHFSALVGNVSFSWRSDVGDASPLGTLY